MLPKILRIFLSIGGLILIGIGLFLGITLCLRGQIAEKPGDVAVLLVIGTIAMIIGLREGISYE